MKNINLKINYPNIRYNYSLKFIVNYILCNQMTDIGKYYKTNIKYIIILIIIDGILFSENVN